MIPYTKLRAIINRVTPTPPRRVSYFARPVKSEPSNYYLDRQSFFEKDGQTYDVVMVGASIIEAAEWEDLFPSLNIANRGIYGDTTAGVIARLDSILATKAEKAFIMVGLNDLSRGLSVPEVYANYEKIVMSLKENGISPYIQSTILGGERKADVNLKLVELNQSLQKLASESEDFIFIDLNSRLTKNGILDPRFSKDQVHLNGDGYAVWQEILRPHMLGNQSHNALHSEPAL